MATITANIDATQTVIPVSTDVVTPGSYYTIGSEAILVHGTNRGPDGRAFNRLSWSVERGVAGTTKATHTSGATLTQYYPEAAGAGGGGGGGVTVGDGTTEVVATSITFPAGTVSDAGGGVASVGLVFQFVSLGTVTLETPELRNPEVLNGVEVGPVVPAGSLVQPICVLRDVFHIEAGATLDIQLGDADGVTTGAVSFEITANDIDDAYNGGAGMAKFPRTAGNNIVGPWMISRTASPCRIVATIWDDGSGVGGGSADLYAIIASPA